MANKTLIQWCDSTVNPVMGCDGCELWPTNASLKNGMVRELSIQFPSRTQADLRQIVEQAMGDDVPSILWKRKEMIVRTIIHALSIVPVLLVKEKKIANKVLIAFKEAFKCYAGRLHLVRGGRKGYAPIFERVTEFPGRTAEIARSADLSGQLRPGKTWLDGLPRMIFVSDMGDVLSKGVSNHFLLKEIIEVASSPVGAMHIWLWLTKRPQKMAAFSKWLITQNINWPENLVAMTSVTCPPRWVGLAN